MLNNIKEQSDEVRPVINFILKGRTLFSGLSGGSSLLLFIFSRMATDFLFALLFYSPQDIIRATQHASPLHHLPFSILSFSSPHPSYLNLPAPLLSSLPPSLLLPGAPCGSCHNRRWNGFICSNVVWAAAWHGTERHFIPVHRAPLPLFLSPCLQFMCFQTGQSTPLSCAGLPLPLPPTISALSVSVKSHQPSLSHTIIFSGKLTLPYSRYFSLFSPVHSILSLAI